MSLFNKYADSPTAGSKDRYLKDIIENLNYVLNTKRASAASSRILAYAT